MAILTDLREREVNELALLFGIELSRFEGVLAGSVNTNYLLVHASGDKSFLRVFEAADLAGAEREARMLRTIAERGVPTPMPRQRTDGAGAVASAHGKPVMVFPFFEGTIRCQKIVTDADTRAVGAALARMHLVGEELGIEAALAPPSRFGPDAIVERLDRVEAIVKPGTIIEGGASADEILATTSRLRARLRAILDVPTRATSVPLIHGDLFRDNVLFDKNGRPTLLDFESASTGSVAFDLAVTLLAWCFGDDLDFRLARAMLAGYCEVRGLAPDERIDLGREAALACVRFASTRLTDFELRPRGLGLYKDHRRWLARLDALDGLENRDLATALGAA